MPTLVRRPGGEGLTRPRLLVAATVPATLRAFLLPLARHFRASGWQVDAAAHGVSTCHQCIQAFDRVWDVEWSRNPLRPHNLLQAVGQLKTVVASQGYDLVHVHTPVAGFVTRLALRSLVPRPVLIYTAHGFHFHPAGSWLGNAAFVALERLAGRWTDYLVTINREDEGAARRYRLVPPDHVWYMPGIGVDTAFYRPEAVPYSETVRVRRELGLGADGKLFLMVAEFNPRKRHRDALAALACLGRRDVHLALAGHGPLLGQMQRLALSLGISEQVRFLGFRSDIPALMRASLATLLPSTREGLNRSIMESLSLQVPAIGTRVRGIQDLLADGCGLLVGVGNVRELSQAMAWVLAHADEARAMAVRGREKMIAQYDLKHVLGLHRSLYSAALEHTSRALAYA